MPEIGTFKGNARKTTLAEAIDWLEEGLNDGVECPCCGQLAKVYKRKLNSAMGFVLLLLHRRKGDENEWVHVPSFINAKVRNPAVAAAIRGDWAKLVHWGLIDALDGQRADGSKRIGYYRITPKGRRFANNQIKVSKHIWIYNGEPTDDSDEEMVSILDVLGDKFDYTELMQAK